MIMMLKSHFIGPKKPPYKSTKRFFFFVISPLSLRFSSSFSYTVDIDVETHVVFKKHVQVQMQLELKNIFGGFLN